MDEVGAINTTVTFGSKQDHDPMNKMRFCCAA
jgi:hypothetical protein